MSVSRPGGGLGAHSGLPVEVFEPAPVGVLVCQGERHLLTYMNQVYRDVFGDRPLGTPAREAFADLVEQGYLELLDEVFATGEPVKVAAAPVTVRYAGGNVAERYFSFSLSKITEPGGGTGISGVLAVVVEVTEEVTAAVRARTLAEERHRALQRYESLVAVGTQMVWVTDARGAIIERSPDWERVTGLSWERLRGDGWLDSAHPQDRAALADAWFAAVRDAPDLFQYDYRLRHADGEYRHCRIRAVPLRDGDAVREWVGACVDIEDTWLRERRNELLARARAAVLSSHRAREAIAALSGVFVPALADGSGIYLLPSRTDRPAEQFIDGDLVAERIAVTARDGLPPPLPRLERERIPPDSVFAQVVRDCRPHHATFPAGGVPERLAPPGAHDWLTRIGAHSGVLVPVVVEGTVAAVVSAFACAGRDPIGAADIALMEEMLRQAHAPISHALRLQYHQRVARALQHSLLTDPPDIPDLRLAARYRSSSSAAEVGGDWYDAFVLPDGITVMAIGDVAGHDLEAAVTMSRMRNMLRSLAADRLEPPGEIVRRLDVATQALDAEEGTATCVLARIEGDPGGPWRLHYTVAGHPPPLIVTLDGNARFLEDAREPLLGGVAPEDPRASAIEALPPGCTVLLYTDGLVERPTEPLDDGLDRLRHQAADLARESVDGFCDRLLAAAPADRRDDIAMIALRVPPE